LNKGFPKFKQGSQFMNERIPENNPSDKEKLVSIVIKTFQKFFGGFQSTFGNVPDPRFEPNITYPLPCLIFTAVLMFLCKIGARRQVNWILRNSAIEELFKSIFKCGVPHGDTLNNTFSMLTVEAVAEILCLICEKLIRSKILYPFRLLAKYFVIAIDGTGTITFAARHCEHCLTKKVHGKDIFYHYLLEAKLVTRTGFSFSIMTEFVENPHEFSEKQDCELKAFYRLAPRLKARFPRLPICLSLDGLFAKGPVFDICRNYGWKYVIVLKDGCLPTVQQEFKNLLELNPANKKVFVFEKNDATQNYRWINDIDYVDTEKRSHKLDVIECIEFKDAKKTRFVWATNFQVQEKNVEFIANEGGRDRWKIEHSFNIQKNGGYELEHAYSKDPESAKVFYFALQIAHILTQLIEKGSILKEEFPKGFGSLKNLSFQLLEAFRNLPVGKDFLERIEIWQPKIRFNTS